MRQADKTNNIKEQINYRKSIETDNPKMGTSVFMSNVTALSAHAMEYLFTHQQHNDILSIVETSIVPNRAFYYKRQFERNNRKIYSNDGVPSPLGGKAHGGELLAVKQHLNSMPIDQSILDCIAQQTNSILRISAMTFRIQGMTLLIINAYFFDTIGTFPINKLSNKYWC